MAEVSQAARRFSQSAAMAAGARLGLACRGFVYLMIGWLAVQIARGHGNTEANQKGALADIARHSGGKALLAVIGVGLAGYALWRFSEAAFGTAADGPKAGPRLQSLVRGVVYAVLAVTAFGVAAGSGGQGQSQQQESVTARLMRHPSGRALVVAAGLVVVGIGIAMIAEGIRGKFEKQLTPGQPTGATRTVVLRLGMVGTIARGVVFGLAGALAVQAAISYDPSESTGLDGALRTVADRPYGGWLLSAVALGLMAFGLYGFATARWART